MSAISTEVIANLYLNKGARFFVRFAENALEVEKCLRLRYRVFAQEMGARLSTKTPGIDHDRFDDYCKHLMVFDSASDEVVATTRLLLEDDAIRVGLFYSETEFDLHHVLKQPGHFMEVGRTCIHPDFRKGSILAILWQGIAMAIQEYDVDYLIGCASISLHDGDAYINSVMTTMRKQYYSADNLRVKPRVPLKLESDVIVEDAVMPTLLKGYLRQGAKICGEPHWDAEFHVADVFVLLASEKISQRYQRHFIQRD